MSVPVEEKYIDVNIYKRKSSTYRIYQKKKLFWKNWKKNFENNDDRHQRK